MSEVRELADGLALAKLHESHGDYSEAYLGLRRDVEAFLARPHPAPALVRDATDAMIEAGLKVDMTSEDEHAVLHNIWHAMQSAAPATDGESERLRALLFEARSQLGSHSHGMTGSQITLQERIDAALAARPAVEHDRAIEEAREDERDRLYELAHRASDHLSKGEFVRIAAWLLDQGAMPAVNRQRARDGQSGGGA